MRIAQGAEAFIDREGDKVIKTRPVKAYRVKQLDERLRKLRTRTEARILERLQGLRIPGLKSVDETTGVLEMEYLDGPKLRDVLDEAHAQEYAQALGALLQELHARDVVHGDLTTSNMIVVSGQIYLIDFGLSYFSKKVEDKAVDLHLLHRALTSRHHQVADAVFARVLEVYDDVQVRERLEAIERRGRYKTKGA